MKINIVQQGKNGGRIKSVEHDAPLNDRYFTAGRMTFLIDVSGPTPKSEEKPKNDGYEFLTLPYAERVTHLHNLMKLHLQKCEQEICP